MMSNLKSLEELRAEMSENAMVRIKGGLSRDQTQEGSLEATPVKKALFPYLPYRCFKLISLRQLKGSKSNHREKCLPVANTMCFVHNDAN